MEVPRNEYPRPDWVRREWLSLNGEWSFAFDDRDQGLSQGWMKQSEHFDKRIVVPFPFQSSLSGIGDPAPHPVIWYRRSFQTPADWSARRVLLHFGAVDYQATVWVNGQFAGSHEGGYVPFALDITGLLGEGENRLTLRVADDERPNQPRGKQSAKLDRWGCWYTRVSGIWQPVWLEPVHRIHLRQAKLLPDIDRAELAVRFGLSEYGENTRLRLTVRFQEKLVVEQEVTAGKTFGYFNDLYPLAEQTVKIAIPGARLWSPESPDLYDLELQVLEAGLPVDTVQTYFGMRKVATENGRVYLNNKPYYLRMVLDQGIWADGIYTPRTVEEIRQDVAMTKAFGFNGARKHQKIEDPYYYYFCDRLGLLVWSELPSSYSFDERAVRTATAEWQQAISRDYNHPSIMAWVPVNESWGTEGLFNPGNPEVFGRTVEYLETMYHLTKALDGSRLVISNDGWHQATTDLITIHDYSQDAGELAEHYRAFKADRHAASFLPGLPIILPGYAYRGQPILITEFGGVKTAEQGDFGWGYGEAVPTYAAMGERIGILIRTILAEAEICGFCYTQLTDTEQEVNGLMNAQRVPKLDPNKFREIFSAK
jgi:beta-galactosidase/beta-glucuronidase